MTHVNYRLTAKNRDQLWNPTLGNRVWATFAFLLFIHPFNGPLSGTTQVSRYQKGKINLDFTEARDSEWQWNPLGHMQVCTSLQADNHTNTPLLSFLQAGCPSCRPTNSVKALKAQLFIPLPIRENVLRTENVLFSLTLWTITASILIS